MAHPRDSRVSFQPRDQYGRSHDPAPQEALESSQKLSDEQRGEILQAVSIKSLLSLSIQIDDEPHLHPSLTLTGSPSHVPAAMKLGPH